MLDRPPLDDDKIIAGVQASYGLTVTALDFLPIGYDMNAGVYRAQAGGQSYFLKVKSDAVTRLSVLLPRYLNAQGIDQAVAPLPTITPALWGAVDQFALLLYPFIEGQNGWGAALPETIWIELGAILKRLHTVTLPPDLLGQMPQETFIPHPARLAVLRRLHAAVPAQDYDHPAQQRLAAFWRDHADAISQVITRTEQLGTALQQQARAGVVCHTDIHAANMLIAADGRLHIVDWDQPVIAPRERDLMFVTRGGGFMTDEQAEAAFFRGYGPAAIDPLIMAYYCFERVMEDLAEFGAQVFLMDSSDETKHDAVYWFMAQFGPGSVLASST